MDAARYARLHWLFATISGRASLNGSVHTQESVAPLREGTTLLNFASAAVWRFRIVWTVTILQQAMAARGSLTGVLAHSLSIKLSRWQDRISRVPCRRVGQTLALFGYLRRSPK